MQISYLICGIFFLSQITEISALWEFNFLNCGALDDEIVEIYKCQLKVLARGVVGAQIAVKLKTTITECTVHVRLMKKESGWRPFLYTFTTEVCAFMRNKNRYVLAKIAYDNLVKFSNLGPKCPYNKGEILYFDTGNKSAEQFDIFLRSFPLDLGEYGAFIKLYVGGKLRGTVNGSITYRDYKKIH